MSEGRFTQEYMLLNERIPLNSRMSRFDGTEEELKARLVQLQESLRPSTIIVAKVAVWEDAWRISPKGDIQDMRG
jgi:hypothetical protein